MRVCCMGKRVQQTRWHARIWVSIVHPVVQIVAGLATVCDSWAAECGRQLSLVPAPCGALQVTDSDHKPVYAQLTVRLPACKHDAKRARSLDIISSITATAVQSPALQVCRSLCLAVLLPAGCCRSLRPRRLKLGLAVARRRRWFSTCYLAHTCTYSLGMPLLCSTIHMVPDVA